MPAEAEPRSSERVLRFTALAVVLGSAVIFPFVTLPSADQPDILPKLVFAKGEVVLLAVLWISRGLLRGRLTIRRTPLDIALLTFVLSAVIATVVSFAPILSLYGTYTRWEGLATIVTYVALYWIIVQTLERASHGRALMVALVVGGCIEASLATVWALMDTLHGTGLDAESANSFGGLARAVGTMANANNLAVYLAMLLPLAVGEAVHAAQSSHRIAAINACVLLGLGLALTFGRGAWLGAGVGVVVVLTPLLRRMFASRKRTVITLVAAGAMVIALVALGTLVPARGGIVGAVGQRIGSLASPASGSGGTRLGFWGDTLHLVAAHPVAGWGLDTFGNVFPRYETTDWTPGSITDKAHSDLLQVAASQGLLGVAAYLSVIAVVLICAWRARRRPHALAYAGAFVAFEVGIQLNFSWIPVTVPFFMFLAGTMASWDRVRAVSIPLRLPRSLQLVVIGAVASGAATALIPLAIHPVLANIRYADAQVARANGDINGARVAIADARSLDPTEAEYAVLQGDIAFQPDGESAAAIDWSLAKNAYTTAANEGCIYSDMYANLATVEMHLGDKPGALQAARTAAALSPFDSGMTQLVHDLGG